LAQVIRKKQGELTTFLSATKVKLEQPVSGQLVEEVKEQNSQVTVTIAECKEKFKQLRQRSHMLVLGACWR